MIEKVIKQDLEELHDHLEVLHQKYGRDFHFFGYYGIEGDEEDDNIPVYGAFAVIGDSNVIHKGIHNILKKEVGVEFIMDALRCYCKHILPAPTESTKDLRDKVLELIQLELTKYARENEAEEEVENLLDSMGLAH